MNNPITPLRISVDTQGRADPNYAYFTVKDVMAGKTVFRGSRCGQLEIMDY